MGVECGMMCVGRVFVGWVLERFWDVWDMAECGGVCGFG